VRALAILFALFGGGWLPAHSALVINELQAANYGTLVLTDGSTPDWIELYNAGRSDVELLGMQISINGKRHRFEQPLRVPSGGHTLLLCSGQPQGGPEHVGFVLDRAGGTLLLIAADEVTIIDVFTYPALRSDIGMGRIPDGSRAWSLLARTTPGEANLTPEGGPVRGFSLTPELDVSPGSYAGPVVVNFTGTGSGSIRYTLDGSTPSAEHGQIAKGPTTITATTIIRAVRSDEGLLPSPELHAAFIIDRNITPTVSLALAHADLFDPNIGIYAEGPQANYSRGGLEWERRGHFQDTVGSGVPVGVRISGSGSRGQPKRSFKLYLRDRYDSPDTGWTFADGTRCDELMLRADATPSAFLRNTLLTELVEKHGLEVEVQPARTVQVVLNGESWGLYRAMPPKDAVWLRQRARAEAVDVLEGPAFAPVSGGDALFEQVMKALVDGAPLDSIAALADLNSLVDLACLDLYTGRADHDLNVRCFRPRTPNGKWRWVLFDMDLWAPPNENTVQRMCSASQLETPFLPQLMAHPELREKLLTRLTALLATALHPAAVKPQLDSLHLKHKIDLLRDRDRWGAHMEVPDPGKVHNELLDHVTQRPQYLMQHLAEHTSKALARVRIEVPPAHQGSVFLEGLPLPPGEHRVLCLSGVPTALDLRPAEGFEVGTCRGLQGEGPYRLDDLSSTGPIVVRFRSLAR